MLLKEIMESFNHDEKRLYSSLRKEYRIHFVDEINLALIITKKRFESLVYHNLIFKHKTVEIRYLYTRQKKNLNCQIQI